MSTTGYANFTDAINHEIEYLKAYGTEVDTGRWQGVPTEGKPDLVTLELMDVSFRVSMWQGGHPESTDCYLQKDQYLLAVLQDQIKPNLPWADDHFEERVSRFASNPGKEYKNWPWWKGQDVQSMTVGGVREDLMFTHTYQERFWPKFAGLEGRRQDSQPIMGIRYEYGDLDDVVNMLVQDPHTRQAYLPIFFPEDTGAVHGGRIPCTLGYHFLLRNDQLHLWYDIRSCDAVRHFRDDVYLATRLALWVIDQCKKGAFLEYGGAGQEPFKSSGWQGVRPGILTFSAHSFHVHKGDLHLL